MRFAFLVAPFLMATIAQAEVPKVLTDIPVVQSLVAQVMGETGTPDLLLRQGGDPHSFQLKPSQARAVSATDLLFWVGEDLTPWLARAVGGIGMAGENFELIHTKGLIHPVQQGEDDNGVQDLHVWLDPENAKIWLAEIAAALSTQDPKNAETYAANANTAIARLTSLMAETTARLESARGKKIVVSHDAYGHFANRFGIEIAGTLRRGDAARPGAAHVQAIRETLAAGDIACAFQEPQQDAGLLESVTQGTGVKIAVLDPSGSSLAFGPALYETLIRDLATGISDCVGD